MRSDVSLNGVSLRDVSRDVIITGVREGAPAMQRTTQAKGTGFGAWVVAGTRSYLEITVSFALRNSRDAVRQAEVLERVNGWAAVGGLLRVGSRPGRRLRVVCEQLPAAGDVRDWAQERSAVFRAYDPPCWEDEREAVIACTGAHCTAAVWRHGTMETAAAVRGKNVGGAAAGSVTIAVGSTRMAFEGLALGAGETLAIDCGEDGLQRIRILGADGAARDASGCRTGESSDELLLTREREDVALDASQEMAWTITHRGRYA